MRQGMATIFALVLITSAQVSAYDLTQHEWQHRLLVLIAPQAGDPDIAAQQRDIGQRQDALQDRDIRVIRLYADRGFFEKTALTAQTVQDLRVQLGVTAADRVAILIGKDGGIKKRAALDIELREILLLIDSMPMRRSEMRAKKEAGLPVTPP